MAARCGLLLALLVTMDAESPVRWSAKKYRETGGKLKIYGGELTEAAFRDYGVEGPVEDDDWDVLFTHFPMGKALQAKGIPQKRPPGSRPRLVNHCEYFTGAGQKCHFQNHLNNVQRVRGLADKTDGQPRYLKGFNLWDSFDDWRRVAARDPDKFWLIKPCAAGNSKGIFPVKGSEAHTIERQHSVAQEYVQRPYLMDGRKFHLRMYLFVTRYTPTVGAFVFNEGVIFWSRSSYRHDSVSQERDIFSGHKEGVESILFADFWRHLDEQCSASGNATVGSVVVWARIVKLVGEVFEQPTLTFGEYASVESSRGYTCSDFFGLDVMLTEDLWPVLLEANMGPNLWVTAPDGLEVERLTYLKTPLVRQMVHWASLRVAQAPTSLQEAEDQETLALRNFTRVL